MQCDDLIDHQHSIMSRFHNNAVLVDPILTQDSEGFAELAVIHRFVFHAMPGLLPLRSITRSSPLKKCDWENEYIPRSPLEHAYRKTTMRVSFEYELTFIEIRR